MGSLSDDEIYDEIDRFHNERDSETTNQWGRKKTNFYGTDYVDLDFGGVNNSDEEELLDLEEKDAIRRQKKQDSSLAYLNFDDFDGDELNDLDDDGLKLKVDRNDIEDINQIKKITKKKIKPKDRKKTLNSDDNKEHLEDEEMTVVVEHTDRKTGKKRAITYEIMKNKGLTVKRRKDSKHARIKNRKSYNKALIRRRSQVPDVQRELTRYDGEKRGIRASTIRSVKLQ